MAWMAAGEKPTAAKLNAGTAAGVATAAGRLIVTDGANSVAERTPTAAYVATAQSTGSTAYTDLSTAGPSVTVTTGTQALIVVACNIKNSVSDAAGIVGIDVTGATTLGATNTAALVLRSAAGVDQTASFMYLLSGLTAGSNTFKLKYRVTSGTATFAYRRIAVIPL